jgi:hypothetical protein
VIVVPVVTPVPDITDPMNNPPEVTDAMVRVVVEMVPTPVKAPETDSDCGERLMGYVG